MGHLPKTQTQLYSETKIVIGSNPTDWDKLEPSTNSPISFWVVTNASVAKGSPVGCYRYGVLIAISTTKSINEYDLWKNLLIYIPDSNGDSKIYVRSKGRKRWNVYTGNTVEVVS